MAKQEKPARRPKMNKQLHLEELHDDRSQINSQIIGSTPPRSQTRNQENPTSHQNWQFRNVEHGHMDGNLIGQKLHEP